MNWKKRLYGTTVVPIKATAVMAELLDREIDEVMLRTKNRPIPSGRVDPAEALTFSVVTA